MEITRKVILDLLPLYLADEVSADTRALVEEYLETDPELAERIQRQTGAIGLPGDIPIPLTQDSQIKAYRKSKMILTLTVVFLAILMTAIIGIIMVAFLTSA